MSELKYLIQSKPSTKGLYRLTLTAEAFALAVAKGSPMAGYQAIARTDGKWDCVVSPSIGDQLEQMKEEGEHKWDVVVRLLKGGDASHGQQ
jgi:hypothetical protein